MALFDKWEHYVSGPYESSILGILEAIKTGRISNHLVPSQW